MFTPRGNSVGLSERDLRLQQDVPIFVFVFSKCWGTNILEQIRGRSNSWEHERPSLDSLSTLVSVSDRGNRKGCLRKAGDSDPFL